ncbi:MAG: RNA polymerase factor sigma-54 [Verrucomicrobiae bacterium]|nr:RNA polymerase factor sigma-54 [Verrucomicrobiae bacterium]MCB1091304.1 RNA polymerase factor sigma-54 [Verrucomicrobiae bacterium]
MAEQRFEQSHALHLQQTIAPQMQQSLQVLQAPTLELRHLVRQELEENPVLEDESVDVSLEEAASKSDDEAFEDEFAELSALDQEWRDYMAQARMSVGRRDDADERHQFMLDSLVAPKTLQEHLTDQLNLSDANDRLKKVAELLIGNTDENGFFQSKIEDLCFDLGIPLPDLQEAKDLIQTFDPVGVGADDLRECLLIQLDRLGKRHSLEFRIIDHHLDDLAMKRYPLIAKKLSVTPEQITRAAEFIATLDPKPGRRFGGDSNNFVSPDVVVERIGGEWTVTLTNDQVPRLRISNAYKDLMAQTESGRDVRSYIRDKIRSGKFLIRSIHQRQQTIETIAKQIVSRQEDFLEKGPANLHPMTMAQIAEVVGVHETTVSRAVSGKYIATPHGVFEMKYFFTTGYQTESGESLSNTSVKKALAELVAAENPKKPLSDQTIVTELKKQGINIARRTVAKYRDELNILPSHMRKSY